MSENVRSFGAQDTGFPVLDSTVNLAAAWGVRTHKELVAIHATLLELAAKEPRPRAKTKRSGPTSSTPLVTERSG